MGPKVRNAIRGKHFFDNVLSLFRSCKFRKRLGRGIGFVFSKQQHGPAQSIPSVLDGLFGRLNTINVQERHADTIGDGIKRNAKRGLCHGRGITGHTADGSLIRPFDSSRSRNLPDDPQDRFERSTNMLIGRTIDELDPVIRATQGRPPGDRSGKHAGKLPQRNFPQGIDKVHHDGDSVPGNGNRAKIRSLCPATAKSASPELTMLIG